MDFETYWTLFRPDAEFENRKDATRQEWDKHPEKQASIIEWLQRHGAYKGRNPYFFVKDWQVKQTRGGPTDYNGKALPKAPVFSAKYNGKWGMYTQEDIDLYGLEKAIC